MGKILLVIGVLLGGAITGHTQDYGNDAIQLAARISANSGEGAEIAPSLVAEIGLALEAVAQSNDENASFVTQQLQIHSFQFASTQAIEVYADANADWAKALLNKEITLEQTPLRHFAAVYDLQLQGIRNNKGITLLSLRSEKAQNMKFIANEVSFVDDVMMVELPAQEGIGNDIKAKRVNGGWMITYIYSYEDCSAGCYKQCEWQFGVTANNEVKFLGSYGQLPSHLSATVVMDGTEK